jgi:transposase
MKQILKQVLGVDVDAKNLVVTLGRIDISLSVELYAHKVFKNNSAGFLALTTWMKKLTSATVPLQIVMEATGVYHEKFAYYLDDAGYELSIVLPNKISNYKRTLEQKTITDKTMSEAIAQFGLERKLDNWQRPNSTYKALKQLTRERNQLINERTLIKNQLHAELTEAQPNQRSIQRFEERLALLKQQEQAIKQEIAAYVAQDEKLKQEVEHISSIPGAGSLTAVTILAETNGFELIRNKKQLVSYSGLDIKEKISGTSVRGKARISKRGNKNLRKAMYFPALTAIKHNDFFKGVFIRLVSKSSIKMKGAVAVQRKILELSWILYKNKTVFDVDYHKNRA